MQKKMILLIGLAASLASGGALAAGWSTGPSFVTNIEVGGSPVETYLTMSPLPNNRPACATQPQAFVSASSDQVRQVATAALLSGKEVRVYWDATCKSTSYGQISRIELVN